DEELIVGTGDHARAAADAHVAVEIDDAVATLEERTRRADCHARRVVALIAEDREEETARAGEAALFDSLHPAAIDADRNLMFCLTSDRARVAADAFPKIDREPVVGHRAPTIASPPPWRASHPKHPSVLVRNALGCSWFATC